MYNRRTADKVDSDKVAPVQRTLKKLYNTVIGVHAIQNGEVAQQTYRHDKSVCGVCKLVLEFDLELSYYCSL